MAQRAAGRGADPMLTRAIDHTEKELQVAVDELRNLAQGLVPAALADAGLVAALEELASRASLPVTVTADARERPPPGIEGGSVLRGQRGSRQRDQTRLGLTRALDISRHNSAFTVRIADDGVGGADIAAGTGIRGLVDRVEGHHGRLSVESEAGRGTTLTAEFPCE